jgi:type IV pilus assembly protein PilX
VRLISVMPARRVYAAGAPLRAQQGIVLVVALLVLVALTIASLGLLRSVDTTTTATGNLGFKKDIYRQSSVGIFAAMNNLVAIRTSGNELPWSDNTAVGYYATSTALPADDRGIPLILANAAFPSEPGATVSTANVGQSTVPVDTVNGGGGYVFRYTAERLCPATGEPDDATNPCRKAAGPGLNSSQSLKRYPNLAGTVYIRLTLRVDGPKNSVSYYQAMVL